MPEIRALTLHQPWASLVAWGVKHYETRPKPLSYRGPLAIHAAKAWSQAKEAEAHALWNALADMLVDDLPVVLAAQQAMRSSGRGCVVAVADLVACERMILRDSEGRGGPMLEITSMSEVEQLCGYWRAGRYAYRLANVRRLDEPIPARGKQGLWRVEVPEGVLRA